MVALFLKPFIRPRSEAKERLRDIRKQRARAKQQFVRRHTAQSWRPILFIATLLVLAHFVGLWHPLSSIHDIFASLPDRIAHPDSDGELDAVRVLCTLSLQAALPVSGLIWSFTRLLKEREALFKSADAQPWKKTDRELAEKERCFLEAVEIETAVRVGAKKGAKTSVQKRSVGERSGLASISEKDQASSAKPSPRRL